MACLSSTILILSSFTLYLLDQGTDALTSLLYFLDGHYLEGCLTAFLILSPGLASCLLELRNMWRGHGNCLMAIIYLFFCPLTALLTHLFSIFNPKWQQKSLLLKTAEGFLCAGPQLVLQLALWMRGTLTSPLHLVLAQIDQFNVVTLPPDQEDISMVNMTIFGRDFSSEERYMFGVAQLCSIFISFLSLFFSVLHFNQLEAKTRSVKSAGKVVLGVLFFLLTIVYRCVGLALLLCFLGWWSSIIIFLMFFTTVLTALCIGDSFLRASVYGIWSFLVPVGYTKDPMEPLDYNILSQNDAETDHSDPAPDTEPYEAAPDLEDTNTTNYVVEDKQSTIRSRSSYFLTSHTLSSLFILYPSIAIMTVLVTRAQNIQDMDISTAAIFPINYLSYIFLPLLGLCLAVSILIVRPFHRADRGKGEILKGTIIV